jgi:hypothetical protein
MATNNNVPVFSFFKAPVSNTKPHKVVSLLQIYNAIKGDYYKERTGKLRAILSPFSFRRGVGGEDEFSPLSCGESGEKGVLVCADTDFQITMEIVKVLIQHAAFVFRQLPTVTLAPINNPKMALFQALPAQFDRAKYIEVAAQLQIPESTADKQIARFLNAGLLTRQAHGSYTKKDS